MHFYKHIAECLIILAVILLLQRSEKCTQPVSTRSKLTIETLEQGVKCIRS